MVDRRRAGRRQWTASWALAGAPRGRRGDPPAAAVRGAEHLLAHPQAQHVCVPAWLLLTAGARRCAGGGDGGAFRRRPLTATAERSVQNVTSKRCAPTCAPCAASSSPRFVPAQRRCRSRGWPQLCHFGPKCFEGGSLQLRAELVHDMLVPQQQPRHRNDRPICGLLEPTPATARASGRGVESCLALAFQGPMPRSQSPRPGPAGSCSRPSVAGALMQRHAAAPSSPPLSRA